MPAPERPASGPNSFRCACHAPGCPSHGQRPSSGGHSWQVRRSGADHTDSRVTQDAGRRECEGEPGTHRGLVRALAAKAPVAQDGRRVPEPLRHGSVRDFAREDSSRVRTPTAGWRSAGGPRTKPAGGDSPRGDVRARRTCRGRSPVRADFVQFRHKLFDGRYRRRRGWWPRVRQSGWRQPPPAHFFGKECVCQDWASFCSGGNDLGHHPISVGHQHGLAGGCQANVFAELAVQNLQTDGSHLMKVASRSYHCQFGVQFDTVAQSAIPSFDSPSP